MTESESPSERLTRPSLLVRIRDSQDEHAWKSFVTIYAPLVQAYCRKRGVTGADADDITQEVFAKINRSIARFEYDRERGRFRDWLGAMTYSELCRFMARSHRGGRGVGGSESDSPNDEPTQQSPGNDWTDCFHAHILATALDQIRSQFEPQTWDAFEAVWLQCKSSAEVATQRGIPVQSVYVAKSRVLKRLREKVLELAEEIPTLVSRPK